MQKHLRELLEHETHWEAKLIRAQKRAQDIIHQAPLEAHKKAEETLAKTVQQTEKLLKDGRMHARKQAEEQIMLEKQRLTQRMLEEEDITRIAKKLLEEALL